VRRVLGNRARLLGDRAPGAVRFTLAGPLHAVLGLRTAVAAYLLVRVPGRRPSALLGDATLFDQVEDVRRLHPPGAFGSFRVSAPGRDSAALRRLREALTDRTGLPEDPDDGELYLRIRRAGAREGEGEGARGRGGWEALVRLSPRPLSARPWRAFNLPGALNATIAAAMVELSRPRPADRVLNLMCGSGTILVERLARDAAALAVGCDLDPAALDGTRANLAAAGSGIGGGHGRGRARGPGRDRDPGRDPGRGGAVQIARMDATALAVKGSSFDVLLADLPYGHRMGSHQGNAVLYPAVLAEAARATAPGGVLVVVTHELRLFERCLEAAPWWSVERAVQVYQKGHHPVIYLLRRRPEVP